MLIDAMGLDGTAVNPNGKQSNLTGFLYRSGHSSGQAECVIILCLRCSSFPLRCVTVDSQQRTIVMEQSSIHRCPRQICGQTRMTEIKKLKTHCVTVQQLQRYFTKSSFSHCWVCRRKDKMHKLDNN